MIFFIPLVLLSIVILGISAITQASRFRVTTSLLLLSWNLGLFFVALAAREGSGGNEAGLGMGTASILIGSIVALLFFSMGYRRSVLSEGSESGKDRLRG